MWDRFGDWLMQATEFQFFGSAALAALVLVSAAYGVAWALR